MSRQLTFSLPCMPKMEIEDMARNFGHFRTETSCGLHEGFIYTAGIHGKVRAEPTN